MGIKVIARPLLHLIDSDVLAEKVSKAREELALINPVKEVGLKTAPPRKITISKFRLPIFPEWESRMTESWQQRWLRLTGTTVNID